jgi:uncharacterized protein YkwD
MRSHHSEKSIRLQLERLEDRAVPSTVDLTNGTLTVMGTSAGEQIAVTQAGGTISVAGANQTFNASSVKLLVIDSGAGNDTISVSSAVTATTIIYTGNGNDVIHGGGGQNTIYGGGGNDTITGGTGTDVIYSGSGHDVISAPAGAKIVQGNAYQTASPSVIATQIVQLTNQFRIAAGLSPLTVNGQLTAWANMMSQNMVNLVPALGYNGAMSHTLVGSNAPTLQDRAQAVGYQYWALGENIAYGFPDVTSLLNAWMNSAPHRANILNSAFTQIGAAVAYTPAGLPYYTQAFGVPLPSAPVTSPPTTTPPTTPPPTTTSPPTTTLPISPPTTPPPSTITVTDGFAGGASQAGKIYATGSSDGMVTIYDMASGAIKFRFQAYAGYTGSVRVAVGDVTGNGEQDVVVAPGAGMASTIEVFDGSTGQLIRSFNAYGGFQGGVFVAVGDLSGLGIDEIITGADAGGGPNVKAFDSTGKAIYNFNAYSPSFAGGVRVAAGDVNGDGKADIITSPGAGMASTVEVFSGATGGIIQSFTAYGGWQGGVFVAAGDLNGDGRADIVTGADAGGGANVKAFNGLNLSVMANFLTDANFSGGVRVAVRDVNGDGKAEIITALGRGGNKIRLYDASGNSVLASFLAADAANPGGDFIA